jgi:hypothetical protein
MSINLSEPWREEPLCYCYRRYPPSHGDLYADRGGTELG